MSAKKKIVNQDEIDLIKQEIVYVILIKGQSKHKMRKQHYERDKESIHKAGWKLATNDQVAKQFNISFGAVEVLPEESKKRKKKVEEKKDTPVEQINEKEQDIEE